LRIAGWHALTDMTLVSTSTASYLYDNNGNMISKTDATGTTQFVWDFENRLTQVVTPSAGSVTYKYDALGRRIQRTPSSGITCSVMRDNFEDAQIDGAFIRDLTLVPSNNVRIGLIRAPKDESERQVSVLSELQFHEIHSFHCNFDANPWLEIKSHATMSQSEYLNRYQHGGAFGPEVRHFQIICDEGEINILAPRFSVRVVEEIPHRGPSEE